MITPKIAALTLAMAAVVLGVSTLPVVAMADEDKKDPCCEEHDPHDDECCDDGDNTNFAVISDDDTNTQVNSATVVQTQGSGSGNFQASSVWQSNWLSDDDVNQIFQAIFD
jgi:hypothetical protein